MATGEIAVAIVKLVLRDELVVALFASLFLSFAEKRTGENHSTR